MTSVVEKTEVAAGCRKRHKKCTPAVNSELAMRSRVSPSTGPLAGLTTSCVMVVRYSKRATDAAAVYCWPLSESCSGAKPVSAEGGIKHVALGEPGTGTAFTGESAPKRQSRSVPPSRWSPCSCTVVLPAAWPTAGLSESTRGSSYCSKRSARRENCWPFKLMDTESGPAPMSDGGTRHSSRSSSTLDALTSVRLNAHCRCEPLARPVPVTATAVSPLTGPDAGLSPSTTGRAYTAKGTASCA
eukprot:scaffold26940_cov117-Phaeocystis_antarctica.AAC.13